MSVRSGWYVFLGAAAFAVLLSTHLLQAAEDPKGEAAAATADKEPAPGSADAAEAALKETLNTAMKNRDKIVDSIDAISKSADGLLMHADATDKQKDLARNVKLNFLFRGASADPKRYSKPLVSFATQLKKELPDSPAAALGSAYILIVNDFSPDNPSDAVVSKLEQFQKEYPKSPLGAQLFSMYAGQLFAFGEAKQAHDLFVKGKDLYKDNPEAQQSFDQEIEDLKKKGELIGKPMELVGPTLDGTEFNVNSFKGKVVLVDFWATWCGPCIAEMPNVLSTYQKLHPKGFEVVAVSLDNDESALKDFVKEKEIPWTQIFFREEKDRGWDNPLAKKYEVQGIPATFLLDREGRIVSIGARGELLEKVVAKFLSRQQAPLAN